MNLKSSRLPNLISVETEALQFDERWAWRRSWMTQGSRISWIATKSNRSIILAIFARGGSRLGEKCRIFQVASTKPLVSNDGDFGSSQGKSQKRKGLSSLIQKIYFLKLDRAISYQSCIKLSRRVDFLKNILIDTSDEDDFFIIQKKKFEQWFWILITHTTTIKLMEKRFANFYHLNCFWTEKFLIQNDNLFWKWTL